MTDARSPSVSALVERLDAYAEFLDKQTGLFIEPDLKVVARTMREAASRLSSPDSELLTRLRARLGHDVEGAIAMLEARLSSPEGTRGDVDPQLLTDLEHGARVWEKAGAHELAARIRQAVTLLSSPSSAPAATPRKPDSELPSTDEILKVWRETNEPRVSAATPAPAKCADGHEWSHQFGDDWTPDDGARCDCGQVGWGDAIRKGVTIRRLSAAEWPAPTCATCKHADPDAKLLKCYQDVKRPMDLSQEEFGCTLHEPAHPGPVAQEKEEDVIPAINPVCGSRGVDPEGHCLRCGLKVDPQTTEYCPPGFLLFGGQAWRDSGSKKGK